MAKPLSFLLIQVLIPVNNLKLLNSSGSMFTDFSVNYTPVGFILSYL